MLWKSSQLVGVCLFCNCSNVYLCSLQYQECICCWNIKSRMRCKHLSAAEGKLMDILRNLQGFKLPTYSRSKSFSVQLVGLQTAFSYHAAVKQPIKQPEVWPSNKSCKTVCVSETRVLKSSKQNGWRCD